MSNQPSKTEIKYRHFVLEYLKDRNGTRAAIAAGYAENSAHVTASKLLKNPKVIEILEEEQIALTGDVKKATKNLRDELYSLAYYDQRELYDEKGNLKPIHELTYEQQKYVTGYEIEDIYEGRGKDKKLVGQVTKVKTLDRRGLLIDCGKIDGAFVHKIQGVGKNGAIPIEVYDERPDLSKLNEEELEAYEALLIKATNIHEEMPVHADQ